MFMSVTPQAAVHLGNDYAENLHSIKNQPKRTLKQLLNVTEKLIRDQKNFRYPSDQFAGAHWRESVQIPSKHGRRRLI